MEKLSWRDRSGRCTVRAAYRRWKNQENKTEQSSRNSIGGWLVESGGLQLQSAAHSSWAGNKWLLFTGSAAFCCIFEYWNQERSLGTNPQTTTGSSAATKCEITHIGIYSLSAFLHYYIKKVICKLNMKTHMEMTVFSLCNPSSSRFPRPCRRCLSSPYWRRKWIKIFKSDFLFPFLFFKAHLVSGGH